VSLDSNGDVFIADWQNNVVREVSPASQLQFSPSSVNFGTVNLGALLLQNVTLTNTGTTTINFTGATITRSNGANLLTFNALSFCGPSLGAGKSCVLTVIFFADSIGSPAAVITFNDNAAGSPQKLTLSANITSRGRY